MIPKRELKGPFVVSVGPDQENVVGIRPLRLEVVVRDPPAVKCFFGWES
jgi:hypothetical protein